MLPVRREGWPGPARPGGAGRGLRLAGAQAGAPQGPGGGELGRGCAAPFVPGPRPRCRAVFLQGMLFSAVGSGSALAESAAARAVENGSGAAAWGALGPSAAAPVHKSKFINATAWKPGRVFSVL